MCLQRSQHPFMACRGGLQFFDCVCVIHHSSGNSQREHQCYDLKYVVLNIKGTREKKKKKKGIGRSQFYREWFQSRALSSQFITILSLLWKFSDSPVYRWSNTSGKGKSLSLGLILSISSVMVIVSWKVIGLGQSETIKTLKFLIDKHRPCVIFLSETKQKKKFLDRKRIRFKFSTSYYVVPNGLGGGLALWWNEEADISILSCYKNLIDTHISIKKMRNHGSPPLFMAHPIEMIKLSSSCICRN
ncbi:hypothetical protein GQ457_14G013060 [Hibiscus cannabinus]